MDPKKLAAFASSKGGAPPGKKEGGGGKGPPGKKGGDQKDDKGKDKNKPGGDDGDGGGGDKFGELKGCLKEHADDVEASIDELDHDDLTDPEKEMSPEDTQILKEGLQTLDKKLYAALHQAGEDGFSVDDAHKLASEMEEDEHFQDAGLLAGWLYRASQVAKEAPPADDSSGQLPHDEEEEEEDDHAGSHNE